MSISASDVVIGFFCIMLIVFVAVTEATEKDMRREQRECFERIGQMGDRAREAERKNTDMTGDLFVCEDKLASCQEMLHAAMQEDE